MVTRSFPLIFEAYAASSAARSRPDTVSALHGRAQTTPMLPVTFSRPPAFTAAMDFRIASARSPASPGRPASRSTTNSSPP